MRLGRGLSLALIVLAIGLTILCSPPPDDPAYMDGFDGYPRPAGREGI